MASNQVTVSALASNQVSMPALGRPFTLGMLYDARKDELCTGITLWDRKTIDEKKITRPEKASIFKVTASDSIEEKSSLMDINASLKASFLGGLIEVGGSAKYLNDHKKFKNQSRVTLQYKATTRFEQLSVSQQQVKLAELPDKFVATHVVTGILYGANAFFVFDSERLDVSSTQKIEGHMQAAIRKIPSFSLEGEVDAKLSDEEKAATKKFSCKFYGDFILPSNPATFKDAVKTYMQLPNLLGNKEENAVPVKVWLTPLSYEVSLGLLRKAQDALEDMKEIEMRCNDALEDEIVDKFPEIKHKVRGFRDLCNNYTTKLQETMKEKFPAIKAGKEDGRSVEKLLDDREKSPFSHKNLDMWLEREINIIRSCVGMMDGTGIKIVQHQSELEKEVLTPGVDHTLCFAFTSLGTADPYLKEMENYLCSLGSQRDKNVTAPAEDQWYSSAEAVAKVRAMAEEFSNLAKGLKKSSRFRFLVAVLPDKDQKGAAIYHYKGGSLQPGRFSKPEIRDVKTVTDRRDLLWYATDLTLDPDTANYRLILSQENKKATRGVKQSYPDLPQRFDECPQVLCKEGLNGIHYWEVEWSNAAAGGEEFAVGVAYDESPRKGNNAVAGLGNNVYSWCFGWSQGLFKAWYKGVVWRDRVPPTGCKFGVFLNCPAGTLSFYSVSSNALRHLYTFQATFTQPLYPGLWVNCSYVALSPTV
ncbi:neoverrucotoxin subunit alpha-like [Parambassis ranga]|uniref:Neoverrucotoxin subunit alpha-like n=1 Tax=Parambassis ranga TaxID=210632 RepID=A0A6P7ISV7_9TELE|nr:neoverrucotoxin subunit alpha-like [Parambassis ranga]